MFKKIAVTGGLLALILAGFFAVVSQVQAAGEVKIGLSAPITGDWAEYGADFKRSVSMVFDRVNKEGGIQGKKVILEIADSRGDAKEAVLIAEKFVANPAIVAQIGDFSSSCTMAAAPVYEQAKMVQISPTASHQDWTKKGEFMFRVVATQGYEGPYNARWAVKDLGKKKIATVYINNDWGVDANKYFVQEARALGAEIVAEEAFTPGEKDFSAIITKLKRLNPDLVYLPTFYADFSAIMNQADRAHYKPAVMANSSLFSPKTLELGGKAVEGTMLPVNYFKTDPRPAAQKFTRDYQALYGAEPDQFAALAYDAAGLLAAALKAVGTDSRAKVREGLVGLKGYEGATGPMSYDKTRDPAKTLVRITIKDGTWALWK